VQDKHLVVLYKHGNDIRIPFIFYFAYRLQRRRISQAPRVFATESSRVVFSFSSSSFHPLLGAGGLVNKINIRFSKVLNIRLLNSETK